MTAESARVLQPGLECAPRVRCQVDTSECPPGTADAVLAGEFTLNGETHQLGAGFDWRANPSTDREWLIQLNKFYFAPALALAWRDSADARYLRRWIELTGAWIEQDMDAGFIAADVTGRRLQNWCIAFHAARQGESALPGAFVRRFLTSLEAQAAWLRENLHAARNHRTLELYALLLCAIGFPGFSRAAQWREFAITELSRNVLDDFRADGGHVEQSTHYHCIALRNHLLSLRLLRDNGLDQDAECLARLHCAAHFAARLHMPDGRIAAFSDSDRGSYSDMLLLAADLLDDDELRFMASDGLQGAAPSADSVHFECSGYAVLRSPWQAPGAAKGAPMQLVFDCGPLGEGNHGHFDALSFEAHAGGEALVVDPGRGTYAEDGPCNWRAAFRQTRAHSTVEIDGLDQVRYESVAGRMKVRGPAPVPGLQRFATGSGFACVAGSVRSAEYAALHERRILQVHGAFWVIVDELSSPSVHVYRARLQLAAQFQGLAGVVACAQGARVSAGQLDIRLHCSAPHSLEIEQGWVSQRYGERQAAPRPCLAVEARSLRLVTVIVPGVADAVLESRVSWPQDRLSLRMASGAGYEISLTDPGRWRRRP